jgi:RND family efflux transporter MFP subunit
MEGPLATGNRPVRAGIELRSARRCAAAALSAALGAALSGFAPTALAQELPPAPVRYTLAREHEVRRGVVLSGSVRARTASLVATEVEGLVAQMLVREGDRVRSGQPLARLRTAPLDLRRRAAVAGLKEAEARLKLAERGLARARELFGSGAIAQQQLDEASYEVDAWQGRVERLGAEIAQIELDLERSAVPAPYAGVVVARRCDVGEWLEVGDPVAEMISLDDLEVEVEVPERYFHELKTGETATVRFESLPGVEVEGRIAAVVPRADLQARTFPLRVRFGAGGARVGAGMLAQVSLPVGDAFRATLVPKDAIVPQGPRQVVYLLDGDDRVSLVPVSLGAGVGSWVAVEGDVRPGQKVVTRGNERLQPGQPARGKPLEYPLP